MLPFSSLYLKVPMLGLRREHPTLSGVILILVTSLQKLVDPWSHGKDTAGSFALAVHYTNQTFPFLTQKDMLPPQYKDLTRPHAFIRNDAAR
jgi:hypothetical protein